MGSGRVGVWERGGGQPPCGMWGVVEPSLQAQGGSEPGGERGAAAEGRASGARLQLLSWELALAVGPCRAPQSPIFDKPG